MLLLGAAFGQGDYAVYAGDGYVLYSAAGPVDFYVVDLGGLAEAEVRARSLVER